MKKLSVAFGLGVFGVLFCLVMTIYTGVKENQERNSPSPLTMPTPALPSQ